jgi:RNA polymerase sigma-70 factor (ECF subfamily)
VSLTNHDSELVMGCRAGQQEAYRQLLSKYEGYIYSLCYRLTGHPEDALDVSQEAMLKVVTSLGSFQVSRAFKPWLRQVVVNVCLNFLRGKQPREMLYLDTPMEDDLTLSGLIPAGSDADPWTRLERLETRKLLQTAVERLPAPLRMTLVLRHQEDMSYQEIADLLSIPKGTVKTHLFRARNLLRQILSDTYGWEE